MLVETDKKKQKQIQEEKNKIIDMINNFYFSITTLKDIQQYIDYSRVED